MKIWNWVKKAVGGTGDAAFRFAGEVFTSFLGHEMGERVNAGETDPRTRARQTAAAAVGAALREMTPEVKREIVRDALDFVECQRTTGSALKQLLAEANSPVDTTGNPKPRGTHIHNGAKRYENKLAKFIEEVTTVGGKEAVLTLDDILRLDADSFFAEYELWNNDRWAQPARYYWDQLKKLQPHAEAACDRLNAGIRAVADEVQTWKGARR